MIAVWLYVFILMFALDMVWALYTQAMITASPVRASTFAALIQLLSAALVLEYVHDPMLIVPAVAGAFAGTYVVSCGALQKVVSAVQLRRPSGDKKAPR